MKGSAFSHRRVTETINRKTNRWPINLQPTSGVSDAVNEIQYIPDCDTAFRITHLKQREPPTPPSPGPRKNTASVGTGALYPWYDCGIQLSASLIAKVESINKNFR